MDQRASKPRVVIIGAGVSGLCMAAALQRAGVHRFTILEKAGAIGGTWRENEYPGSGCDVPSHLYCFSFEPNPGFSRAFAGQAEILRYLEAFADKRHITSHVRFGVEVASAVFDERRAVWAIATTTGERLEADVVVSATGQLNRPHRPDIPGLSDFGGALFHSAEWKRGHDLRGERVAVIGSGASAIQIVPSITPLVSRLHVFQRTPSWVIPKLDYGYPAFVREAFRRMPALLRLNRYLIYWLLEPRFLAFTADTAIARLFERRARAFMEAELPDPELRRKLIPNYPPGCKRVLISSEYLAALQQSEVEVVTSKIERVTRDGIVTEGGRLRAVDTIILATGFDATKFLVPMSVTGLGGERLEDSWRRGAEAYLGMAVSGFPNFFMLYGPNTNLGHNSIIFMVECQARYVAQMIAELQSDRLRSVSVRRDRMQAFNEALQSKLSTTVWNAGCSSWYTNEEGKQTNNWPYFTLQYWWRTRKPHAEDFEHIVVPLGASGAVRTSNDAGARLGALAGEK